jgi:hypothetical protein
MKTELQSWGDESKEVKQKRGMKKGIGRFYHQGVIGISGIRQDIKIQKENLIFWR